MKSNYWSILFLILTIGWMSFIFMFSAQHAEQSSQNSAGIVEQIIEAIYPNFSSINVQKQEAIRNTITVVVRKSAHMGEFALLSMLIYFFCVFARTKFWCRGRVWISFTTSVLYAASDEFHQLFVPGRSGEMRDVIIDACGVAIGILLASFIMKLIQRKQTKTSGV